MTYSIWFALSPDDIEEVEKLASDAMQWIEANLLDYARPGSIR